MSSEEAKSRFRSQTLYNRKECEAYENQEKKQEGLSVFPRRVEEDLNREIYPTGDTSSPTDIHGPTTRYVSPLTLH